MHLIKELIVENSSLFPSHSTISLGCKNPSDLNVAMEVMYKSSTTNKWSGDIQCPDCKCPYLKYTKEQMERNPVQFNDEYGSVLLLTRNDIDNVRKKWRKIKNDPTTFGTLLFINLLNDAPETAKKMSAHPGYLCNGVVVYDEVTVSTGKRKAEELNTFIKYIDMPEYVTFLAHDLGVKKSFNETPPNKKDLVAYHTAVIKTATTHYAMDNTPEIIASLKKNTLDYIRHYS